MRAGYVPDDEVAVLFDTADAVVFPCTHFDGQRHRHAGPSASRAMIVSDVGGLPELVQR
jgi:hypothetical protein